MPTQTNQDNCYHSNRRINETELQCVNCGLILSSTGEPFVRDRRALDLTDVGAHRDEDARNTESNRRHDRVWAVVESATQKLEEDSRPHEKEKPLREIGWDELPTVIPAKELVRRKERGNESLTAEKAFNKIFPPDVIPGIATQKHGREELLEGQVDLNDGFQFQINKEDFYAEQERLDISEHRVQDIYERAKLNKIEREIFRLESLDLTQTKIAEELRISQPAVSKRWARILAKLEKADIPPRQDSNRDDEVDGRNSWDNPRYDQHHNGKTMATPTLDTVPNDDKC